MDHGADMSRAGPRMAPQALYQPPREGYQMRQFSQVPYYPLREDYQNREFFSQNAHSRPPQFQFQEAPKLKPLPKTVTFDGSGNWKTFQLKLHQFLMQAQIPEAARKYYLIQAVEGRAADFLTESNTLI